MVLIFVFSCRRSEVMFWVIAAKDPAEGTALGIEQFEDLSDALGNVNKDTNIAGRPTYWVLLEDRQEPPQSAGLPRNALVVQLCD